VRFRESDLEGQRAAVRLEGWNVRERIAQFDEMRGSISVDMGPNATSFNQELITRRVMSLSFLEFTNTQPNRSQTRLTKGGNRAAL
jgi:hypothetical protein